MTDDERPVLVTAATGQQGGATVRALIEAGERNIRVLVRDPEAPKAKALAAAGAQLSVGSFDDPASLRRACQGVRAVFSMQRPTATATGIDWDSERVLSENFVDAALAENVETVVHTAASGVGPHRQLPGWDEGRWSEHAPYFENKEYACDLVRGAGFANWTLIMPSTYMEHEMVDPAYFLDGRRLVTVVRPDVEKAFIAVDDIGRAAAAAMLDPGRFAGVVLYLAGDRLTFPQVVEILSRVDGRDYVVESGSVDDAIAAGLHPVVAQSMVLRNVLEDPSRPEDARALGLSPMDFETWARTKRKAN